MCCGEIRQLPAVTVVPQEQFDARFSRVVLLRMETNTWSRVSSSAAVPEKVSGLPGASVIGSGFVGGVTDTGAVIVTVGGTAVELTSQVAVAARRSDCPAVSTAVAQMVHWSSYGSVTSYDQVALVAPTTSGRTRNELYTALTVPSSWR